MEGSDSTHPSAGRLSGLRILVVDDNDARLILTVTLEQEGASIVSSASSADGFEQYVTWRPNVIVSDIAMPGEDGHTMIGRVRDFERGHAGKVPAVAVTGYASDQDDARAIGAGFQAYLPRPFEAEELILVLARLVGRRGS